MENIKTSNKILIGLVVIIFISISTVILINGFEYRESQLFNKDKMAPVKLGEFSNVSVSGNIFIEIIQSIDEQIFVSKKLVNNPDFKLQLENKTLYINFENNKNNPNVNSQVALKVLNIDSISVKNHANVKLNKFTLDSLFISQDETTVNIDSLTLNYFHLNLSNNSNIWCNGLVVNNMNIDFSNSTFSRFVPITAEKVTGEIRDKSQFIAKGSIAEFNVKVDSTGRINKYY